MTDLQNQVNQLRISIDLLTQDAFAQVNQGDYNNVNDLLTRRFELIKKLIYFSSKNINKAELQQYLVELRERDQSIIQRIVEDKNEIKNALLNLNKMKQYAC